MSEFTYAECARQDFSSPPPKSNIRVSILNGDNWSPLTIDDEEPLLLGGDDAPALCTVGEAMTFLREAADRPTWPLITDPSNSALYAFEKAIEAYKVIGREGLAGVCDYMEFYAAKMSEPQPDFSAIEAQGHTSFDPYEAMEALAAAREERS
jgi:hypothetical protein